MLGNWDAIAKQGEHDIFAVVKASSMCHFANDVVAVIPFLGFYLKAPTPNIATELPPDTLL